MFTVIALKRKIVPDLVWDRSLGVDVIQNLLLGRKISASDETPMQFSDRL